MLIPYQALSAEALDNLISEYCLRDWGLNDTESPINERKTMVWQALASGQLLIFYSEHEECAFIKLATELNLESDHNRDT